MVDRAFEGSSLDVFQEFGQLVVGSQADGPLDSGNMLPPTGSSARIMALRATQNAESRGVGQKRCDNADANQKANGSRSGAVFDASMAWISSPDTASQERA